MGYVVYSVLDGGEKEQEVGSMGLVVCYRHGQSQTERTEEDSARQSVV